MPDGWTLSYQEVSNNVYIVRLMANFGSVVKITDSSNFESIIDRCVESAEEIEKRDKLT